jgi:hypothetical protein
MRCTRTAIIGIDTRFEFVCTEQPVRFRHGPLTMDPFRLDGIEPRAFTGQQADYETHPHRASLHLLIVLPEPVLHCMTAMPGGVVPDQAQRGEALRREWGRAPRQKLDGDGTDGTPRHKPQPHPVRLLRPGPQQQPITGQGLGLGVSRRRGQLLQLVRGLSGCPATLVGLGQSTPPHFIAKAQGPRGPGEGSLAQPVAALFFRR